MSAGNLTIVDAAVERDATADFDAGREEGR